MGDPVISLALIVAGAFLISFGSLLIMSVWFRRIDKFKIFLHVAAILSIILGALSFAESLDIVMGDLTFLPGYSPFITGLFIALLSMVLELAGYAAIFTNEQKKKDKSA